MLVAVAAVPAVLKRRDEIARALRAPRQVVALLRNLGSGAVEVEASLLENSGGVLGGVADGGREDGGGGTQEEAEELDGGAGGLCVSTSV